MGGMGRAQGFSIHGSRVQKSLVALRLFGGHDMGYDGIFRREEVGKAAFLPGFYNSEEN